jgi:ribose transport system ATP-binding protein
VCVRLERSGRPPEPSHTTAHKGVNKVHQTETEETARPPVAVAMRGMKMSFAGVQVLKEVDFEVKRGEVHALLGENGAGKSTLMKILEGVYVPDGGEVLINGKSVPLESGLDAKANGITMVFQEFSLIPTLTVAQNILLGREPQTGLGFIDERKMIAEARKVLAELNVDLDPRAEVGPLAASYWQITEIAKALSQDANVLVLDEPTASLTKDETETLFRRIRMLRDAGMSIVYISHRMAEIYDIADRITVMRNGRRIRTAAISQYPVGEVIADMLGEQKERAPKQHEISEHVGPAPDEDEPSSYPPSSPTSPADRAPKTNPLLQIRDLHSDNGINGLDLDVRAGEVVGLAGLMGSGRSQLVRAIFGIDKITNGTVRLEGQDVRIQNPRDAIRAGIALVPEDRRVEGLVLEHSVETNSELPLIASGRRSWISKGETLRCAQRVIQRLDVRTSSAGKSVGLLSGGNQQKIVIGKWLLTEPKVFLLDEPTAGIDIGAKKEIMRILRQFAASGKAVIVISSELEELLEVSDRIVVLRNGRVDDTYRGHQFTSEEALHRAVQGV